MLPMHAPPSLALASALVLALLACSSDTSRRGADATPTPLPGGDAAIPGDTPANCDPGAPGLPTVSGRVLYVSPTGGDLSGDGSAANPFASIARASTGAAPGDTIALMAGTYGRQVVSNLHGSESAPIVVRPVTGEHVMIDGTDGTSSIYDLALHFGPAASHLVVDGFEITNPRGGGVCIRQSEHVTVQNCVVHDTYTNGFSVSGSHLIVDHNEVYRAVLQNETRAPNGPWGAAASTEWWRTSSTDVIFRRNHIHHSYGECLIALFLDGGQLVENEIHDCYSVHIYLDHARNIRVERNVLYRTSSAFDRPGIGSANGVLLGHEYYPPADRGPFPYPDENILVANNIIAHTNSIGSWCDARNTETINTFRNVTFAHNVIYQPANAAMTFGDCPSSPASGLAFTNNVVIDGRGVWLSRPAAWTLSHNCWENTPGAPAGQGDQSDCSLAGASVPPIPAGFRPVPGSPLLGAGLPVAGVARDFFCATRSTNAPSIGLAESAAN